MKEQKRNSEFDKKIIESIQNDYSFIAWQSVNGIIEKCEMKGKAIRIDYDEIEFEVRNGEEHKIQNIVSGNRKISLYIAETAMSFQAPLKSISENGKIKIMIPEEYTMHERRNNERVYPRKNCFATIQVRTLLYRKSIYDLSSGGFSIILSKSEKFAISKDTLFDSITIELEGEKDKILTKAICISSFGFDRYRFINLPYGGFKISFCFSGLCLEKKNAIVKYIDSELILQNICNKAK